MVEIKKINREDYPEGKKVFYSYESDKYYDVIIENTEVGWNINLGVKDFAEPFKKHLEQDLFDEYKGNIECYGAFLDDVEAGVMVLHCDEWNNVMRIWDLYVYEEHKRKGIGKKLMEYAVDKAKEFNSRLIILETQTSNYNAVQFYKAVGFELIGFDTMCYSNQDIEKKDVRIEMGYVINR